MKNRFGAENVLLHAGERSVLIIDQTKLPKYGGVSGIKNAASDV